MKPNYPVASGRGKDCSWRKRNIRSSPNAAMVRPIAVSSARTLGAEQGKNHLLQKDVADKFRALGLDLLIFAKIAANRANFKRNAVQLEANRKSIGIRLWPLFMRVWLGFTGVNASLAQR